MAITRLATLITTVSLLVLSSCVADRTSELATSPFVQSDSVSTSAVDSVSTSAVDSVSTSAVDSVSTSTVDDNSTPSSQEEDELIVFRTMYAAVFINFVDHKQSLADTSSRIALMQERYRNDIRNSSSPSCRQSRNEAEFINLFQEPLHRCLVHENDRFRDNMANMTAGLLYGIIACDSLMTNMSVFISDYETNLLACLSTIEL